MYALTGIFKCIFLHWFLFITLENELSLLWLQYLIKLYMLLALPFRGGKKNIRVLKLANEIARETRSLAGVVVGS